MKPPKFRYVAPKTLDEAVEHLASDPDAKVLIISAKQWFVETDVLINQGAGQLGYVFGEPTDEAADAGDRSWYVDPTAVEAAIVAHFGL